MSLNLQSKAYRHLWWGKNDSKQISSLSGSQHKSIHHFQELNSKHDINCIDYSFLAYD